MRYYTISKKDLEELNFELSSSELAENRKNTLKLAFSHFMIVLMSNFPKGSPLSNIEECSLNDRVQIRWSSVDSALEVEKKHSRYSFRIKKDSIYLGDFDFVDATVAFELLKNSEKVEAYLEQVNGNIRKDSDVLVKASKAATDTKDVFTSCMDRFKELYHNTGKTLESVIDILKNEEGYANNIILATVITVLKDAKWND